MKTTDSQTKLNKVFLESIETLNKATKFNMKTADRNLSIIQLLLKSIGSLAKKTLTTAEYDKFADKLSMELAETVRESK